MARHVDLDVRRVAREPEHAQQPPPRLVLRLGQFASRVGHADEALTALKTAARLDAGKSVEPQLALASFYGSVNDKPNEIRRLRMASWIAPANIQAAARLRALGEIPGPSQAIQPEEWAPMTEGTPKK